MERKEKGKEKKGFPRKARMVIGPMITPTYPPLSDFSHAFALTFRSQETGEKEEKERKKVEQRLDHDSPDIARLISTTSFLPSIPSPPSYLLYLISTPRDQVWRERKH